ncbi:MAG: MucR family transcriptional regulator [Hyphomonadaceae bacterium]
MERDDARPLELLELASEIVAAYVSHNPIPTGDLPRLIEQVHSTLIELHAGLTVAPRADLKPAVPIKKSVTDDHIICLEDGKKFKSLKRHLRTRYDMSPEQYREKWQLPPDYPMVAPNYARQRSDLARQMGLGQAKK